jgi:phosphoribosyl-ATP pyrophosphohydrolase/phosphoribosyl-AMP cyclohydrolase
MSVLDELKWDAAGLIPAVIQETETGEVLMVAWMNRVALDATLRTGAGHYWSRSRQQQWRKGETSGHGQHVDGLYADCDRDTLLVQVHQEGVACHHRRAHLLLHPGGGRGRRGAARGFRRPGLSRGARAHAEFAIDRAAGGSYVAGLFGEGRGVICRKIGEEATEVVTAALGGESEERLVSEVADLWFHAMVLLTSRGIPLRRVVAELERRHAGGSAPAGGVGEASARAPSPRPGSARPGPRRHGCATANVSKAASFTRARAIR